MSCQKIEDLRGLFNINTILSAVVIRLPTETRQYIKKSTRDKSFS